MKYGIIYHLCWPHVKGLNSQNVALSWEILEMRGKDTE